MGLDNFWMKTESFTKEELKECPDWRICGGLFSGNGQGSFRGKVYHSAVEAMTGLSLFEHQGPDQVNQMAKDIEEFICSTTKESLDEFCEFHKLDKEELNDLSKMFNWFSDKGASLVAWY